MDREEPLALDLTPLPIAPQGARGPRTTFSLERTVVPCLEGTLGRRRIEEAGRDNYTQHKNMKQLNRSTVIRVWLYKCLNVITDLHIIRSSQVFVVQLISAINAAVRVLHCCLSAAMSFSVIRSLPAVFPSVCYTCSS